ncbi:hypothetical protein DWU89_08030 [Parabacteroides acidifaciens]|uniref:Uncharacterized protein n=1 Tax=Parabacteroides acidifaciens TaxID=2290935 RepID=A0A3D8HFB0_9BACT|nr:hypothetical protein DWU89_08030 [Parabacteroides acidifaciens]RHO71471.1 hypothetical protein DW083_11310 [Parabacteroides sp. AF48-14]
MIPHPHKYNWYRKRCKFIKNRFSENEGIFQNQISCKIYSQAVKNNRQNENKINLSKELKTHFRLVIYKE